MNKKGFSLSLEWLINIMLLLFIVVTLFGMVNKITDDDLHIQEKEVREIALLRDASLAAPGELDLKYKLQPEFELELAENCKLAVQKSGEGAPSRPSTFFCAVSKDERVKFAPGEKGYLEVAVA